VAKLLLVLAMVANGALAALLVGVSGFLFGGGPESMHARSPGSDGLCFGGDRLSGGPDRRICFKQAR
jgi:hypothetical protein